MSMRMAGLISGMDTEGMVKELVKANSVKVDKIKQNQKKLEWKKDTWKGLNTKLYDFYKSQAANFKSSSSYKIKKADVTNSTKVSVTTSSTAASGNHTVSVMQVASAGYMTGGSLKNQTDVNGEAIKGSTKLSDLGIAVGTSFSIGDKEIVVDDAITISDFATELSKKGVNANFDEAQGRFYINSKNTGKNNDFAITSTSNDALEVLGLGQTAKKVEAKDAIIEYNGVEYTGESNNFSINGLTITAKAVTGEYNPETKEFKNDSPITISVSTDVDAAYNSVKEFVKTYNSLVDEMKNFYYEKKSGYDPLTEEEKSKLSESQIEQWEKKAKEGILNRDSTIETLLSGMRSKLNEGIEITLEDGTTKKMSLASLGIVTGDYTEMGKLHILGDPDDAIYGSQENKLKKALADNPDMVSDVIVGSSDSQGIGVKFYNFLTESMKRVDGVSSSLTFFNDVSMDDEIKGYKEDISKWEEKLSKLEDRYYDQFSAMEKAMAKLQQQQSYIASLMGSGS